MDVNWFPGHMAKTLRELKEKIKLVDVVFETCDARVPLSSRNNELDRLIGAKPRLLVLNKADLADPSVTGRWIAWFRSRGLQAMACDSMHKSGLATLVKAARELTRAKTEKALARGRMTRSVKILVVGIPNTGKSTLINAVCGRRLAQTADKPGVTRHIGWIHSGSDLEWMDTPGVLPPRLGDRHSQLSLASTGAIRDDLLPMEEIAMASLKMLAARYPRLVMDRYRLTDLTKPDDELIQEAALLRGCLLPGGKADIQRFAALMLDDLRGGRIGRISLEEPGGEADS